MITINLHLLIYSWVVPKEGWPRIKKRNAAFEGADGVVLQGLRNLERPPRLRR